jgi:class 3 adenylate cyclase
VPGDPDSTSPPQELPLSPPVPHGTVTFVFTDIEGSTELLKRLGDRYSDVVAQHRRILREEFRNRTGVEMDTQGDAFFFSFGRARDAVAAAVAAQRQLASYAWPDGAMLRVRMSLHTGEPVVGEEGYVGIDVVRAARICAAGHGGQVLLSSATAALVGTALPEGVRERDLGAHRLKDIDEPERIYQLEVDGLPSAFPPLRTHGEEPIDFEQRLENRIKSYVESRVEQALGGPDGNPSHPPVGMTKLAAGGLLIAFLGVCLLAAIVVVIVLLVRFAF